MPTALVTGASSGIGWELALELARQGHNLVLSARREDKLRQLQQQILAAHPNLTVTLQPADLSQPGAGAALAVALADQQIDVLVNNAGFGDYGLFWETDARIMEEMLAVNVVALTALTRAILPSMVSRKTGRILNVASTAAFFPGPYMAVYYASKAYVLSFSGALSEELKNTQVTVTCLCPGPTTSEFQERASLKTSKIMQLSMMDAATVAKQGVAATLRGQRTVVPGLQNRLNVFAPRILSRTRLAQIIARAQGPQQS